MTKRILVTGGLGFLGSALVRRLVADGHQVRVLDNLSRGSERRKVEGVEYFNFDVRKPNRYDGMNNWQDVLSFRAADGSVLSEHTDTVFHLAAINGTRHFYERPEEVLDVQIRGTMNVLDACKANNVKELVLFSSSEVYGQADQIPTPETVPLRIADPLNPRFSYAAGKIAAEMMCLHAKHLERVLVIRPHNVYGPDMGEEHVIPELIRRIAATKDGVVSITGRKQTRAYCHVSDFINGTVLAWKAWPHVPRTVVHIGTGIETSTGELFYMLCSAMGIVPPSFMDWDPPRDSPARRCPDTFVMRSAGWWPRVALPDGLKETVAWYLENQKP